MIYQDGFYLRKDSVIDSISQWKEPSACFMGRKNFYQFYYPGNEAGFFKRRKKYLSKSAPPPLKACAGRLIFLKVLLVILKENDFVVHTDFGIGVYRGLKKITVGKIENDFLVIEYLDGDKLYIPVNSLEKIQRYLGPDGYVPKIDKMGGLCGKR